jgi:hypothetical protein
LAAGTKAASLLIDAVMEIPIEGNRGRRFTIDRSHTYQALVFQALIRATHAKLIQPERAIPALTKLFDGLSEQELSGLFSPKEKTNTP